MAGHGLLKSKGEARRLIEQGGLYVNDQAVSELYEVLDESKFDDGELLLRMGKKRYVKLILAD